MCRELLSKAIADGAVMPPSGYADPDPQARSSGELVGVANLLAGFLREEVLKERERCARLAEQTDAVGDYRSTDDGSVWESDAEATLRAAAARIREGTPDGR